MRKSSLNFIKMPIYMILLLLAIKSSAHGESSGADLYFRDADINLENYGTVKWDARWTQYIIPVCWIVAEKEFAVEKKKVRQAVFDTWETSSNVQLVGWQPCKPGSKGIKIAIEDSHPRSRIGRESDDSLPSMWLNFTFEKWGSLCQSNREACITSIAVHEFGHALGFHHEQLHPDAPLECKQRLIKNGEWEDNAVGLKAITTYDADSVMNYCNAFYNNNGVLSNKDKKAIRILFP